MRREELATPSNEDSRILLPLEVTQLYAAAKRAFVYSEELDRNWEPTSLSLFRDALDHLVGASTASSRRAADSHVAVATEHLGTIVAESLEGPAKARIADAKRLDDRTWLRRTYLRLPKRKWIRDHGSEVRELMTAGRLAKGKGTPQGWIEAGECFEKAFFVADELYEGLAHAPLRARLAVIIGSPIVLAAVSAGVGALVDRMLR